jgi:uncharacterized membrane protein SpoIIM required for sporulation/uncharacterized RDD family membrane protein YckC
MSTPLPDAAPSPLPGRPPRLLIDSPTGVPVLLAVAGVGARACAFVMDWLLRALLALAWYVAAACIYHGSLSLAAPLRLSPAWFGGVLAPAAALYFLYPAVMEIAGHGCTPGMRMTGVRLMSCEGTAPALSALLIRNVFRLADSLPAFYGVGLVTALATRDQIRLGDMAAGTILVYEPGKVPQTASPAVRAAAGRARRLGAPGARAPLTEALALTQDYRLLARELARTRARPAAGPRRALEDAYASVHASLHRGAWHLLPALVTLLFEDIPQVTRRLRPHIVWTGAIFVLMTAAGWFLVATHPALIRLFASPQLIASVERGQLWTAGMLNVVPPSVLSLQILTNNIVVCLTAYCAGFLLGLGTLYILGLNGLSLGAQLAFTQAHGLAPALLSFVVAHGCVELSVVVLSAAAGAAVGEALVHPAHASRLASFRLAAQESGKLLVVCVGLLVGCGLIEGYLSAEPGVPVWLRITIGIGYWLFMVALLRGRLWRRPAARGLPRPG